MTRQLKQLQRLRPTFDRCYALDDGPAERPLFLSPTALVLAAVAILVLFLLLLATPFWRATPIRPAPRTASAAVVAPAAAASVATPGPAPVTANG